ncbi:MAG: respiratory nitrate reductase subunit gamma [Acidobacteria bacterium]|nr:respiratory nitrate reductase subunit gamma [Acidobacteriota bacterium]
MVYEIALWAALVLLGIGVIHRIDAWFLRDVGLGDRNTSPGERVAAGGKGILGAIFSVRIFAVLKVLVVDVLFQGRILRDRKDPLAYSMHLLIFFGFMLLLLFHALGSVFGGWISAAGYVPTLNPFMFLTNLAGLMLTLGLVLAVVRRVTWKAVIRTAASDVAAIVILALIAVSGFALEAMKFTSERSYDAMVKQYAGDGLTPAESAGLKAFWVAEYGLKTAAPVPSHDPAAVAQGKVVHEAVCQSCHTSPRAAFVSYPLSRALAPVAAALDRAGAVRGLWYLHVLTCVVGLGYLAFSKMFHVVSTPVSLLVAEVAGGTATPAGVATRQAIELDGCSHGGACHETCPVRVRRLDRIGTEAPYDPMLAYVDRKSAGDLGSRPVAG